GGGGLCAGPVARGVRRPDRGGGPAPPRVGGGGGAGRGADRAGGAGAGAVGRDERAALPGPGQPARARLADRAPGRSGRAYRRVLGDAPAERRVAAQAAGGDGAVVEG